MASDGSPYDEPAPRPTVVIPKGPVGPVRSAAAPDGAAKAAVTIAAAGRVRAAKRRRMAPTSSSNDRFLLGRRDYRLSLPALSTAARPASSRATGTRNGEQET